MRCAVKNYKLTYFDSRGRAEVARLLFAAADVQYDDERLSAAEWSKVKDGSPFGCLPILEVDERVIGQSNSLCRYLGWEFGFMGNSNWEIGKIDETTENIKDMNELTGKLFFHKDGDTKAELQKKAEDMVAKTLKWLDSQLRENGTHGFLVGKNLSVADITSYNALSCLIENGFASSVEGYPVLKAHTDRISNIPAIKRWVNSRPKTPF